MTPNLSNPSMPQPDVGQAESHEDATGTTNAHNIECDYRNENICAICLENMNCETEVEDGEAHFDKKRSLNTEINTSYAHKLPCGHQFHPACLSQVKFLISKF